MKFKQILAGTLAAAMVFTSVPMAGVRKLPAKAAEMEVVDDGAAAEAAAAVEETAHDDSEPAAYSAVQTANSITYTDIDLNDESSYKITDAEQLGFYNAMSNFTITVTGKVPTNVESPKAYALFTLKENDNNYLTVWYDPAHGTAFGAYAFSDATGIKGMQNGHSVPNLFWGGKLNVKQAGEHFKISLTYSGSTDAVALKGNGKEEYRLVPSSSPNSGLSNWNGWKMFLSGHRWSPAEILLGKKPVSDHLINDRDYILDFLDTGEILNVTVSNAYSDTAQLTAVENDNTFGQAQKTAILAECGGLSENDYTAESWERYHTALTAVNALADNAKDWDILDKVDELKKAKEALLIKTDMFDHYAKSVEKALEQGAFSEEDAAAISLALNAYKEAAAESDVSAMSAAYESLKAVVDAVEIVLEYDNPEMGSEEVDGAAEIFYGRTEGLTIEVLYKYSNSDINTTNNASANKLRALFAIGDKAGNHITLWQRPGQGACLVVPGMTGLYFTKYPFSKVDQKWHKMTFSFNRSGQLLMVADDHTVNDAKFGWNMPQWNADANTTFQNFLSDHLWDVKEVAFGRKAQNGTYPAVNNVSIADVSESDGLELRYVKVSDQTFTGTNHSNDNLVTLPDTVLTYHDTASKKLKAEYEDLLATQETLNEADYTAASWAAYQAVLTAQTLTEANMKDWKMADAIDAITAAQASLVPKVHVSSITLDTTECRLKEGETKQLTATVLPADTTEGTVTWTSDNDDIATVDENGLVTAIAPGTATITAAADGQEATCTVTVYTPEPASIDMVDEDGNEVGDALEIERTADYTNTTLQVSILPSDAEDVLSVAVEDEEILSAEFEEPDVDLQSDLEIEEEGNASLLTITPKKNGSTKVTVSCENYPEVKKEFTVSVATDGSIVFVDTAGNRIGETGFYYDGVDDTTLPKTLDLPGKEADANYSYRATSDLDLDAVCKEIKAHKVQVTVTVTYVKQNTLTVEAPAEILPSEGQEIVKKDNTLSVTVDSMTYVKLKAPETYGEEIVDGKIYEKKFVGWLNTDTGKYASYAPYYSVLLRKNLNLKPVYEKEVAQESILDIVDCEGKWDGSSRFVYEVTSSRVIPAALLGEGETKLLGHGILVSKANLGDAGMKATLAADGESLQLPAGVSASKAKTTKGLVGTYTAKIKSSTQPIYARAYAIYVDKNGDKYVAHGEIKELAGTGKPDSEVEPE